MKSWTALNINEFILFDVWIPLQEGSNVEQICRESEYGVLTYVCKTWAVYNVVFRCFFSFSTITRAICC